MANISFDYDNTLSRKDIQSLAQRLISEGHNIFIVTTRLDNLRKTKYKNTNNDILHTVKRLGINPLNVIFTNQLPKHTFFVYADIQIHVDDNPKEVMGINSITNTKAFLTDYPDLEKRIKEYLTELENF